MNGAAETSGSETVESGHRVAERKACFPSAVSEVFTLMVPAVLGSAMMLL